MPPQQIVTDSSANNYISFDIVKNIFQNSTSILIVLGIASIIITLWLLSKKEFRKEQDQFKIRFDEVKKELKKYKREVRKDKIQLFSSTSISLFAILTVFSIFMYWLFDIYGIMISIVCIVLVYKLGDRLGIFYNYKSVILIDPVNKNSKRLGRLIASRRSPDGWLEILLQRSPISGKGEEILRINYSKNGKILVENKNSEGRITLENKDIELPHDLYIDSDLAFFIFGIDTFEFKYFTYISCIKEDGNPVDTRSLIVSREMHYIMPETMVAMGKESFVRMHYPLHLSH